MKNAKDCFGSDVVARSICGHMTQLDTRQWWWRVKSWVRHEALLQVKTSLSSPVCRHLQANPDHRVDFHNPEVIGSDSNWRRLQILQSLLIQEHKPELNANIPSMPLSMHF